MHALTRLAAASALAVAGLSAQAATSWTDWQSFGDGTVLGQLTVGGQVVNVTYSGPVLFAQLNGGTDYWTQGTPDPYAVSGRPTGSDLIAITGGSAGVLYTISFDAPVTNPYFAIVSSGQYHIPIGYQFDDTPTLVSSGAGYWGGCAGCLVVDGNTVVGTEGHGVVQFQGTFTQLTWTVPNYENWHGFTVGVPAVPEPASVALMLGGLGLLGAAARRRRA